MPLRRALSSRLGPEGPRWAIPLLGVVIAVSGWGFLAHTLQAERQLVETEAFTRVRGLTGAYAEQVLRTLQQVDQITQFIAYVAEHPTPGMDLESLMRDRLQGQPGLVAAYLTDDRGRVTASTHAHAEADLAKLEHFTVPRDQPGAALFVGKPLVGRVTKAWGIPMSRALRRADGGFAGVVVVSADPRYFTSFYSDAQLGPQGVISFVGLDWVVRARRSGERLWYGQTAGNNFLIQQLAKGPQGSYQANSKLDGVQRLLAYKTIAGYPFVVFTGLSEAEVFQDFLDRRNRLVAIFAVGTVLLLAAVLGLKLLERRLRNADQRVRNLTDSIPALISVFDKDQRIMFVNRHCAQVFGRPADSFVGQTVRDVRGEAGHQQLQPHIERVMRGEHVVFESRAVLNGQEHFFQQSARPDIGPDGQVQGFFAVSFDVTDRKHHEQLLAASEKRLRDITNNLPVLISYIDPDERVRFLNATFQAWMGPEPDACLGQRVEDIISQAHYAQCTHYLKRALAGERVEFELRHGEQGPPRDLQNIYIPDQREDGRVAGIYTLTTDVTRLKEVERRLQAVARTDTLTGLANRRLFEEKLAEALLRMDRSKEALALLFLDIDHFKGINDPLGHAGGDAVLKEFAARLKATVRASDTVARLAGDEFVVILEGLHGEAEPQAVARKICGEMAKPFQVQDLPLAVTASIGIGYLPHGPTGEAALLNLADKALYEAKRAGRNTFKLETEPAAL